MGHIASVVYQQYSICGKTRGSAMYFWCIFLLNHWGSMKTRGSQRCLSTPELSKPQPLSNRALYQKNLTHPSIPPLPVGGPPKLTFSTITQFLTLANFFRNIFCQFIFGYSITRVQGYSEKLVSILQNPVSQNPVSQNPVTQNSVLKNPVLQNPILQNLISFVIYCCYFLFIILFTFVTFGSVPKQLFQLTAYCFNLLYILAHRNI